MYPTVYKRSNCLLLLCHVSLNYCPGISFGYCLGIYHGLVSRVAAYNTKAPIDLRDEDAHTVRYLHDTLCNNGGYKA